MNKLLFLLLLMGIVAFGCKSSQKTKAEYKEYEQPKRINKKKTVVIPEVDVDDIIQKAP